MACHIGLDEPGSLETGPVLDPNLDPRLRSLALRPSRYSLANGSTPPPRRWRSLRPGHPGSGEGQRVRGRPFLRLQHVRLDRPGPPTAGRGLAVRPQGIAGTERPSFWLDPFDSCRTIAARSLPDGRERHQATAPGRVTPELCSPGGHWVQEPPKRSHRSAAYPARWGAPLPSAQDAARTTRVAGTLSRPALTTSFTCGATRLLWALGPAILVPEPVLARRDTG